tara:strand:- start:37 stop:357 length:321 start_codon:yes stop_codon:yes gene_type:complete
MEMNFPHMDQDWTALEQRGDVYAEFADHHALLAHAIARQASSPSVQDFVAARQGLPAVRASFMDDRIAFFAGRPRSGSTGPRETILFRTGYFRPDLAQREIKIMHG